MKPSRQHNTEEDVTTVHGVLIDPACANEKAKLKQQLQRQRKNNITKVAR